MAIQAKSMRSMRLKRSTVNPIYLNVEGIDKIVTRRGAGHTTVRIEVDHDYADERDAIERRILSAVEMMADLDELLDRGHEIRITRETGRVTLGVGGVDHHTPSLKQSLASAVERPAPEDRID